MPTTTQTWPESIGQYPIINKILSSIDDNGIQTVSYAFTIKTKDAYKYIPSKDDEYYGPKEIPYDQRLVQPTAINSSKYLVTHVSMDNLNGGLTQIVVNTAGSQNINTPPKIKLIPNYPLIFGLQGVSLGTITRRQGAPLDSIYQGIGSDRNGYGVSISFITESTPDGEAYVFNNLSLKIMPSQFRSILLPVQARQPFSYDTNENFSLSFWQSNYYGFICTETTYERIGGVTLFQLIYKEAGNLSYFSCPNTGAACSETAYYKYE